MNTRTHRNLITSAVGAVVIAAASVGAVPEASSPAAAAKHTSSVATSSSATPALAALVTPNSLFAATSAPPVVVLGPTGSLALPDSYFVAPVETGPRGGDAAVSNPSLAFAPTTIARSTPSLRGGGDVTALGTSLVRSSAATDFGLFSPTGTFLGLVGPGGLVIGEGVLPGQDGGILIGNGADGAEGQDGGKGGTGSSSGSDGDSGNPGNNNEI